MLLQYAENEILKAALKAVKKNIPMQVEYIVGPTEQRLVAGVTVDRTLDIKFRDKKILYCVEIKTNLTKAAIGQLLVLKNQLAFPLLLITNYTPNYIAENLKKNGIEFIDTAGNTFIKQPPIYIFVKGNKPPDTFKQIPLKRAFRPTGLKVVFAFLRNPDLVNKPYREIAATAGVALGTIGWVIRDLKNLGYIIDMGKRGFKPAHQKKMIDRWVTEYPEKLRPKLLLGRFRGAIDWWKHKPINYEYAQWGGEVAAAKLTNYLKPQKFTIYINQTYLENFLIENRLKKDANGDIEILERFWMPVREGEDRDIVDPLLIYADLMATGNQRNVETAQLIFKNHVLRYIKEN